MPTDDEPRSAHPTTIGPWTFDPEDGTLRCAEGERRVEDRAARTLALLCARRGEIVSQTTILNVVWQGRQVSHNSVAVVVADLRRALGENAREPLYIETVAKRGYRLRNAPVDALPIPAPRLSVSWKQRSRHRWLAYLAIIVAAIGVAAGSRRWHDRGRPDLRIAVEPVRNETGNVAYNALANAIGELLVNRIAAFHSVNVYRSVGTRPMDADAKALVVQSRLILWNEIPTLSITTQDGAGHVVWTGMIEGQPNTLAPRTIVELAGLRRQVGARTSGVANAVMH